MGKCKNVVSLIIILYIIKFSSTTIIGVCDETMYAICHAEFGKFFYGKNVSQWITLSFRESFMSNVMDLQKVARNSSDDVVIAFGSDVAVNSALTVAKTYRLPILIYDTESATELIYPDYAISLRSRPYDMGVAVARLTDTNEWESLCLLIGENQLHDGFLEGLALGNETVQVSLTKIILTEADMNDVIVVYQKLQSITGKGSKMIIVHLDPFSTLKVVDVSKKLDYFNAGYVWIFSELSNISKQFSSLPLGIIALENYEAGGLKDIVQRTIHTVSSVFTQNFPLYSGSDSYRDAFHRYASFMSESTDGLNLYFDDHCLVPVRSNTTFKVLNLVDKKWFDVGLIGDRIRDLNSIRWPGNTIFGPLKASRKFFRVVTRPVTPFIFVKGPMSASESCYGDTVCLKILDGNPIFINAPYRFGEDYNLHNVSYDVYCCSGIVVDIIELLSNDMGFEFQMYFRDDNINSTDPYSDLIDSVEEEQAHILAGAVTVTSMRVRDIIFTEPFLFSGFAMVVPLNKYKTSIIAFIAPFDISVWVMIFVSATVVAMAASLFEWNSPFGLNPWGRKRSKNYTLGSALVMVYSVLFGHTVSTKSPKSWPSKVLQNFWAALAIVTVASYTANLAAYLAGNSAVKDIENIYQTGERNVYAKRSSAAMEYISVLNSISSKKVIVHGVHPDQSISQTFDNLRDSTYDVYIEDRPIIEYALTQHDNCTIKITGTDFGENLYSLGLSKKETVLRDDLSTLILQYVEGGYIQNIHQRYIGRRECEGRKEIYNQKYGLEHTGGLFLILIVAMFLSGCLLVVEHFVFKYLVPFARKQPPDSALKSRNVEFINQRLYRIINSEELISPKEAAREMMRYIKDRQFVRVFQKNEIKEASRHQREAMKGVRFYSLYNKLMRSYRTQFSMTDSVFTTDSSGNLYSISEDESDDSDVDRMKTDVPEIQIESVKVEEDLKPKRSFKISGLPRRSRTFNYPRNNTLHKRFSFQGRKRKQSDEVTVNPLWIRDELPLTTYEEESETASTSDDCRGHLYAQTKSYGSLQRRIDTWPSMDSSSEKGKHADDDQVRSHSSSGYETLTLENFRARSPDGTEDSEDPPVERFRDRSMGHRQLASTDRNSNYYGRSLKMKDNRVKSTIRRHALAKFRRHSSSIFDESAVDALSKEDLLILWKKSEIDLQTRLNRVSMQNVQLKRLLRIAEDTGHVVKNETEAEEEDDVFQVSHL